MLEKCWLIVNNSEKYNAEGKDTGKVALQEKWERTLHVLRLTKWDLRWVW